MDDARRVGTAMRKRMAPFPRTSDRRAFWCTLWAAVVVICLAPSGVAQGGGYERAFPESKTAVEKVLKDMQGAASGRLPVLEGFATSADHPLDRYQRGYYQAKFQVTAGPAGGSVVHVSAEVTAWYADPVAAHSGYHLLTSNGRLETDLLDQLSDQLAAKAPAAGSATTAGAGRPSSGQSSSGQVAKQTGKTPAAQDSAIAAPMPRIPESGSGLSPSMAQGLAEQKKAGTAAGSVPDKTQAGLRAEAESLEEVLKSQSHPRNLVVVKKTGTPVVESASLSAKTLFLASVHDEFEMLDFNRDWVHVHISGLSRGWIWRNNLEMPEGIPENDITSSAGAASTASEVFHMAREEEAPFPGDWAPLRGKSVKIVSVEKINETAKDAGPQLRLEFAKSVLDNDYAELAQKQQELTGIVLIFDSVDGGMLAATFRTLQQWKAGKMSDAALWHQCFFDPPETFNESGVSASQ
jgi:hypothetical protein